MQVINVLAKHYWKEEMLKNNIYMWVMDYLSSPYVFG